PGGVSGIDEEGGRDADDPEDRPCPPTHFPARMDHSPPEDLARDAPVVEQRMRAQQRTARVARARPWPQRTRGTVGCGLDATTREGDTALMAGGRSPVDAGAP